MSRFLRLFVAAFLALAVPIQGLAGVTMASCSGGHAPAMAAMQGHDHGAMTHGAHGGAAPHAGMAHGHPDAPGAPGEDVPEGHNCAACAACCNLSAAPVPAVAAASADRPSSLPIPFLETRHASAQARGLERPPSHTALG